MLYYYVFYMSVRFMICVLHADVDRMSKFCFVEYDEESAAQKAVHEANGQHLKGVKLGMRSVSSCCNVTPFYVLFYNILWLESKVKLMVCLNLRYCIGSVCRMLTGW